MTRDGKQTSREGNGGRRDVSIWSANLDDLPRRLDVLSSDELARSQRFHTPQLRDRYVAGRSWVRRVLGSEVGVPPAALRFRYLELGKPVLEYPRRVLDFSLSHSEAMALLAVGPPGGLGVDAERIRAGVYDASSAGLVLSSAELRWVESQTDRDRAFLLCWVRKEAYAKVGGMGMDRYLADLTITGPHARRDLDGLAVAEVAIDDRIVAAVAVPAARRVIYRGRWLGEEAA